MQADKLRALRELLAKAAPLPWQGCGEDRGGCSCGLVWSVPADAPIACTTFHHEEIPRPSPDEVKTTAALIVAAVNALPDLLTIAEASEGLRADAMRSIGELIRTQDNRITDAPIFIVQQKRETVADADYDHDRIVWVDDDHGEAGEAEATELEAGFIESGDVPDGWRRCAMLTHWEFVTACFTEQGCKDYLALDGHNLKEPRIYAAGSYRNNEWRTVRESLIASAALSGAVTQGEGA